ncbi:tRNA uridine-5-carboxymethylaminomethyl(34) synthesis GTPase MnmE [Sodalis sp. CWE]|uniref:tRNA uridine-5-carboxymethylaminomethyl(34) synthesis GTPase MnmE n=1 Tax=Sodalis sp. CWE TaxID=2803816 RepID=UPI001C7CB384|nr:tRNA uridine-5-carboxymethylaminomethyl(34) synthesis GTPase MnmE [Sodalis sp. CWE]MBX4181006.1 tRNA uridine-5-carboxymethylaminomethyl(34) synthesis GTPase MnmE [Sodalis sp. CWE]
MQCKKSFPFNQTDTIAALATPPGVGGVGILRVSGSLTVQVAHALLGRVPSPRQAEYLPFRNKKGETIDQGIAIFFPHPHSLTGEDILELHGHGGPVVLDLLLEHIVGVHGVRIARPGEFLERAFLNDKLDLVQAEAVADLINASSVQAARLAVNSLQGIFSNHIQEIVKSITKLRIHIEVDIDFPNEEKTDYSLSKDKINTDLNKIIFQLNQTYDKANQGNLLREGIKVVIAGKPNVGKSSLLNILVGREAAIVTSIAGTTRDVIRENIHINGIPLNIVDTAGLRKTSDEIERIGIERAKAEIEQADHILFVVDKTVTSLNDLNKLSSELINFSQPMSVPVTIIQNKADLTGENVRCRKIGNHPCIILSARSGAGVNLLLSHLRMSVGFKKNIEGIFLTRRRHLHALKAAIFHLQNGRKQLSTNHFHELLAENLRLAQQSLNEITGEFKTNDLLDEIFSKFCIGK